jgi:hypothetical protein
MRIAGHERIVGEPLVLGRVGHDEQVGLGYDVAAERHITRRFADRPADLRLEPLAMLIDERDERDRSLADVRGKYRQVVQRLLRERVEHVVLPERVEAPGLVGGSKRRFHDLQSSCSRLLRLNESGVHEHDRAL